jgi:hypothetical protein
MAYSSTWIFTDIPKDIVEIIQKDLKVFEKQFKDSTLLKTGNNGQASLYNDSNIRTSRNTWIPATHWLTGFLWYYVKKSNDTNFLYDIYDIDNDSLQYAEYSSGGQYKWHTDTLIDYRYTPKLPKGEGLNISKDLQNLSGECVRKLSFSLQLSDINEYTGGELQIMNDMGELVTVPKSLGSFIVFDSRSKHRVRPVKSGIRKSIVGWVVGPRWK